MKHIVHFTLIVVLVYTGISCTKDVGPIEPEQIITTVSFENDVQAIFTTNCVSCHNTANSQYYGYLDLSVNNSYSELVSVVSNGYAPNVRVTSGDAENSVLWKKINNSLTYGSNMPLGGTLTSQEIETIKVWIDEGALDN